MRALRAPLALSCLASLICAYPVGAQEVAPQPADGGNAVRADEIVVTARKRTERLISVPVTVKAFSAEDVNRYKTDDLARVAEMTPGVVVGVIKTQGGSTIGIRGISTSPAQVGFEQAVSVSVDGVQTSDGRIGYLSFFDVERIEVLKGPQALFFGKNSPAGVISV
ncbi:MAG: TonB-dependent receptor, partial [Sphingobacteriales bacterium]